MKKRIHNGGGIGTLNWGGGTSVVLRGGGAYIWGGGHS